MRETKGENHNADYIVLLGWRLYKKQIRKIIFEHFEYIDEDISIDGLLGITHQPHLNIKSA